MIPRYLYAVLTGIAVTVLLLFLMDRLIALQPGAAATPTSRGTLVFIRVDRERDVETTDESPPARDFVDPPEMPPRPRAEGSDKIAVDVRRPAPAQPDYDDSALDLRPSDGPLVAIVRVRPAYPASLAQRGLEGWVLVEFEVLADGTVANLAVVDSSHRGFEKAAADAAYRFRYKARVVDGEPRPTAGIRYLFRFRMEP